MILNLTGKIAPIACGLLCCCSMVYAQGNDTSEVMLLDTGWEFSQSGTEKWMRATVPGTVHQDLISHELLPNPFYGMNEKKIQWVENEDWEYRTSFIVSEEQLNRDGIQLIFEGLDTYADVYLNGSLLLKADNMFVSESTVRVQIKIAVDRIVTGIRKHYPDLKLISLLMFLFSSRF